MWRPPQLLKNMGLITMMLSTIAGIALLFMMVLTVVDVGGRYFFARSLTGANEIIRISLAVVVAGALPAVTLAKQHISLGILTGPQSNFMERVRQLFVNMLSAVVTGALAWLLFSAAWEAYEFEDVIGYLELPLAPMLFFVAIMVAVTCFVMLSQVFFADLGDGRIPPREDTSEDDPR